MRIFTRVVWEWQGDELVQTEADSYEYEGPVAEAKGGGAKNYKNLERLYGIQADQAEFLGKTFKESVAPAYTRFLGEAQDYGSQANQEFAAQRAGKAASGAISQQQQALEQNFASLGINPADMRYAQGMREMGIQGAAQQAGAETLARDTIRDKGFARQQDAISLGMGTPTQASQAANSAANAATSNLTAKNQASQMQSNNVAGAVQGMNTGYNIYKDANAPSGAADGGQVTKHGILRLKQGGYVQRLARGGFAGQGGGGFMGTPQVQAPPPMAAPGPSPAGTAAQGAATPLGMQGAKMGIGKAAEVGGEMAGSPGVTAFGKGMQMSPDQARLAQQAYQNATKQAAETAVDNAMGGTAGTGATTPVAEMTATELGTGGAGAVAAPVAEVAAPVAAETAGAVGAGTAGAAATGAVEGGALAASGAGLGAAAALGTAVPIIGGGLALYGIGNQLGWWADGGEVTPGSQNQTGEVDGPGGPKDDEVLAALSDGEYVMPKGVVNFYGIKHLENMRKKGLEYEKQMGIG